jgi:hypothetical protein
MDEAEGLNGQNKGALLSLSKCGFKSCIQPFLMALKSNFAKRRFSVIIN